MMHGLKMQMYVETPNKAEDTTKIDEYQV